MKRAEDIDQFIIVIWPQLDTPIVKVDPNYWYLSNIHAWWNPDIISPETVQLFDDDWWFKGGIL